MEKESVKEWPTMETDSDFDLEKLGAMQHESSWDDVMDKARRLVNEKRIRVDYKRPYDLNRPTNEIEIRGVVTGDHSRYNAVIILPEARSSKIRTFVCQCTWNRYVWNRRPIYIIDRDGKRREVNKKFEGRVCSHILGLYWMTQLWPVDYSEVDEEVMRHFSPQILEQDALFKSDYEALNAVQNEIPPEEIDRLSPQEFGFDSIDLLNKSIQQTLEGLFPSVDDAIYEKMFDEDGQVIRHWFDNQESMDYKQKISDHYDNLITLNETADKLKERLDSLKSPRAKEEIRTRLNRVLLDIDGTNAAIENLIKRLRTIYSYEFDVQPNLKAQDAVKQVHWFMVNDPARARKALGDLGVRFNTEAEKLEALEPGAGQRYRQEMGEGPKNPEEVIQRMIVDRALIEQRNRENQQMSFDDADENQRESSFSVISSDFDINDITIYIQKELAENRNPSGYIRRELWGEQRGGLHPHPDAMPISIRDDGNHIFSPEDLGYNPMTGDMGFEEEERGTYGRLDIGSEVKILAIDPRDRIALIEANLGNPRPNHQHIHLWVPLKDIDLV